MARHASIAESCWCHKLLLNPSNFFFFEVSVYLTSVRPVLEYAQLAWCGLSAQDINHLERLQRRAARVITGVKPWSSTGTCHEVLLAHAGLPTLSERRLIAQAVFVFKVVNREG